MSEKSKVIIVPCDSYDKEQVYKSVKAGIEWVDSWTGQKRFW